MAMPGGAIALPEEGERVEKSLGILIKTQFTETDFNSVMGHTEIPARAIPSLIITLTDHKIMDILATEDPRKWDTEFGDTEYAQNMFQIELDKYRLRKIVETNPVAMIALHRYAVNYFYALCMRSKDRKGRAEGVRLGTASSVREAEEGLGLGTKALHALGLGRLTKYQKVYVKKE